MTEKRFKMDNESDIIEFDYNSNEYIQDFMWADGKSWDRICNRLNELYEENEQLKKAEILANYRGEMISFANSLIDDLGGETMREMWDKFREEKYEEWRNLE